MNAPSVFSLLGPLPRGRVAVEASAGTGKTYTLAGLVVRYVAEAGVPVEEFLIVTFTRAAAAELRDRVRTRLSEAVEALRDPLSVPADDFLAFVAEADREVRLDRLERAVADFDAATITTIHGFAQQVLATLGSAAPGDLDATLLDDTDELVQAVCADVLAAESFADATGTDEMPTSEDLCGLCAKVLGNPGIQVIPDIEDATAVPAVARLRRLLEVAVDEVHRRRRVAGTLSFDDLLTQLRDALSKSHAAVVTLRRRFRIALIDEFQDTDPVQWEIFSRLFGEREDDSALVLVADPKQAIYAFRGANVHTFLEAAHQSGTTRFTLGVNWRSDGALLDAFDCLFRGVTFGDPRIEFVSVSPPREHADLRLTTDEGAPVPALSLRLAVGDDIPHSRKGLVLSSDAEVAIGQDLARQVQQLLETTWIPSQGDGARRRVRPQDVAVLVGRNVEAERIQTVLRKRGIPAVVTRGGSVLHSPAATQWRWLLTALARPADPTRARTVALSWFFGWSVAELDAADDAKLSQIQDQLFAWAETLANQGTVELCARIWSDSGVAARVLSTSEGDRDLTDLDHIAALLQSSTIGRRPTAAGLLATLDQLESEKADDPDDDPTARQIESEAEAVQIMTVYVAKGLEFPVVCVPMLWRKSLAVAKEIVFQDPDTGLRTFDIANRAGWSAESDARTRRSLANEEALGENLRLLYVALTRAKHKTLVWWTRVQGSETTGLGRTLFARVDGAIDPELFSSPKVAVPGDDDLVAALGLAFSKAGDAVAVSVSGPTDGPVSPWTEALVPLGPAGLELAVLDRVLPRANRRWSFSAISDRARHAAIDPEDESLGDAGASDETVEVIGSEIRTDLAPGSDLPLGEVAGGTQFGTLVHEVLERVDFVAADLNAELADHVEERLAWNPWPVDAGTLVAGLRAAIESPLGPLFHGGRLRDLARRDRLDELNFELRLGRKGRFATDRDVGRLVLSHLSNDDPLRSWAQRLCTGVFGVDLAGHLTGSIDMGARARDPAGGDVPARFVVVDYKTNALAEEGRQPSMCDYHPDRLPTAMAEHHYPLQALLYSVALHRYLRWRVPGYQPAVHLGGVACEAWPARRLRRSRGTRTGSSVGRYLRRS
jgi:exodeoxyribonuclease V beta subunit